MNYWSIKEIADILGITTQAIYKSKKEYLEKGYIEKDQETGTYKVTITGYNYLIGKRKHVDQEQQHQEHDGNIQADYINTLKTRIEQLENELNTIKQTHKKELEQEQARTQYFMNLFEQKDRQITTYLLQPGTEEQKKKNIFDIIFKR